MCVYRQGGAIRFVNAALDHMGKDKGGDGGTIILTSSISGITFIITIA